MDLTLFLRKRYLYLFIFFVFFFTTTNFGDSLPFTLKSDELYFDETSQRVDAKGNVSLILNDVTIQSSQLSFYTQENVVMSTGNVQVTRGTETVESSSLYFDLEKEEVSLTDIYIQVQPPGQNHLIYIKIHELIDKVGYKIGKHAIITSCSLDTPHYYLKSWRLYYYPNKRVNILGAYLYNDITFFPFTILPPIPLIEIIPIPFYSYSLGERSIIWNFPTIGKKTNKTGWGWFVQNTIDYKHKYGKDSSVLLDWYEAKENRTGEWGYGIRHHYGNLDHYGAINWYHYPFKDNGVQRQNTSYSLHQTLTYNKWRFTGYYHRIDLDERINSSGSSNSLKKNLTIQQTHEDTPLSFTISEDQQFIQGYQSVSSQFKKTFLHDSIDLNFTEKHYVSNDRDTINSSAQYIRHFRNDIKLNQSFQYGLNDYQHDNIKADTYLKSHTEISKKIQDNIDMIIRINYFNDLDQDIVTSDSEGSANNYLYKLPEFEFKRYNHDIYTFSSNTTLRFGHYKEDKYLSAENSTYSFPSSENIIEPNAYYLNQNFSKNLSDLPFKSTYFISSGYEQYVFKNPNKSIFAGDAQYSVNLNTSLSSEFFNFIKLQSTYTSRYAPAENNSPFYAFKKNIQAQNRITERLTFFYLFKPTPSFNHTVNFNWTHSTGYNWLRDSKHWDKYNSKMLFTLDQKHKLSMSMGQELNFQRSQRTSKYSPLLIDLSLVPKEKSLFQYHISYDLNDIVYEDTWSVKQSSITLKMPFGKDPDYQWYIQSRFRYDSDGIGETFDPNYYRLQDISIEKQEHERTLEIGYKDASEEFYFKYVFTIFPQDPIVLRKKQDTWTIEGRFKQQSEERLK